MRKWIQFMSPLLPIASHFPILMTILLLNTFNSHLYTFQLHVYISTICFISPSHIIWPWIWKMRKSPYLLLSHFASHYVSKLLNWYYYYCIVMVYSISFVCCQLYFSVFLVSAPQFKWKHCLTFFSRRTCGNYILGIITYLKIIFSYLFLRWQLSRK